MGFGQLGRISIQDILTLHEKYQWEERGIDFAFYAGTMLALDEVTQEYHKEPEPDSKPPDG